MPIRPINRDKRALVAPAYPDGIVVRERKRSVDATPTPAKKASPTSDEPAPKRAHHKVDRTTDNWTENGDYIVGKGRPPVATRWQKGQSGNPAGPKPKDKANPVVDFEREMLKTFEARVNGETVTLNMGTFAVSLLKAQAAKGSVKAIQLLLELYRGIIGKALDADSTAEIEAWESEVIDALLAEHSLPAKPIVRKARETGELGDMG